MDNNRSVVFILLVALCTVVTLPFAQQAYAALPVRIMIPIAAREPAVVVSDFWSDLERQTVAEVNRRRQANGCGSLTLNRELSVAAKRHSKDMATKNFFSHTGSDGSTFVQRIRDAGYVPYKQIAENLAAGYATPQSVVQGWMDSAGHRANMLNCAYRDIGVGLEINPNSQYRYYWTTTFGVK